MGREHGLDGECELKARIGLGIDSSEVTGHRMCVVQTERDTIPVRSLILPSGETLVSSIYMRTNRSPDDSTKEDNKFSTSSLPEQLHRHPDGKFACRRKTRLPLQIISAQLNASNPTLHSHCTLFCDILIASLLLTCDVSLQEGAMHPCCTGT